MQLNSIFIDSSGEAVVSLLPRLFVENIDSLQRNHPDIPHKLYGQSELLTFLQGHFGQEVSKAFLALKPYAYKADLARYCLMYEYGGVYADLSYFLLHPLPISLDRLVVFRDFMWSSPWDASNGLIGAPPRHKVFEFAIESICANVSRNYYGSTSLCPTGPALFGKAIATVCEAQDLVCGSAVLIDRNILKWHIPDIELPDGKKLHCLVVGDDIVAIKRKRKGLPGLSDFGVATGNDYFDHWSRRDVYDQKSVLCQGSVDELQLDDISPPIEHFARPFEPENIKTPGLFRRLVALLH